MKFKPRARASLAVVASALVALGIGVVAFTWGASGPDPLTSEPERSVEGREIWYDSPQALASASDLVVHARVTDTGRGRTYAEGQGDEYTTRYVTLEVIETLKGAADAGSSIRLEEEGWDRRGVGYVVNGALWSQVGDEGYYFLSPLDGGTYGIRGSFGRVLVKGDFVGPSGHEPQRGGPWKGLVTQLKDDPTTVDTVIREAVSKGEG